MINVMYYLVLSLLLLLLAGTALEMTEGYLRYARSPSIPSFTLISNKQKINKKNSSPRVPVTKKQNAPKPVT